MSRVGLGLRKIDVWWVRSCVCVCMCVCLSGEERERKRERHPGVFLSHFSSLPLFFPSSLSFAPRLRVGGVISGGWREAALHLQGGGRRSHIWRVDVGGSGRGGWRV